MHTILIHMLETAASIKQKLPVHAMSIQYFVLCIFVIQIVPRLGPISSVLL